LDEASAANAVRQMFDSIAPRYDLLNHVLSANVDRLWWKRAARRFQPTLARPEAAVLDICCGTGDMTLALLKHRPQNARPLIAADFSAPMRMLPANHTQSLLKQMRSICRSNPSRWI
jgi:demethylmenaquinone methyltransferase/2-methoxy-6-polyprenyl-1,4-benzoquinol methylase